MTDDLTKNDRKLKLKELFKAENKSFVNELIIPLLVGSKVNASNISLIKEEKYEKRELYLASEDLLNSIEEANKTIKELAPLFDLCNQTKEIMDYYLQKLLKDSEYLSEAMVKKYDKHQNDLKELKVLIKKYLPKEYNEIFRQNNDKDNNYVHYIGMNHTEKKRERFGHCSADEFYAYLKKKLDTIKEQDAMEYINKIKNDIEKEEYLPRQNSGHNTSIPMQLNLIELKNLLEKQSKYYEFLNKDTIEKIIKIFCFRIPYYVGPLNRASQRAWLKKYSGKENEKITPYNFDEVVDKTESAKEFIQRMQNKCSYLHGDDDYCLPKKSLLYSEYNCLQYLNKIQINGSLIEKRVKDDLFKYIFLRKNKPTKRDIKEYLKNTYGYEEDQFLSKIEDIPCDMSSYITFKKIFGDSFNERIDVIENIIKDITIFEDKRILENRLKEIYHLSDEQVKEIKGLNYKGYGRLCKRLLDGLETEDFSTGEVGLTLIQIMRDTNLNLMEILSSEEYKFQKVIDKYNKDCMEDKKQSAEEFIEENLYISADGVRALNQTYKLIEEIERIIKQPIDSYYIECTRTNQAVKKATVSRTKQLLELYNTAKNDSADLKKYNIELNKLKDSLETSEDNIRGDKLFLYYLQLGKCLYTMETIDINNLDRYDIDHIYPQAIIKDDSITNRVLVKKEFNQNTKKEHFLYEVKDRMNPNAKDFYKILLRNNLMSKEKYRRLTENEISDNALNGFVNRQLVSTNQAVKGLISLLKDYKGVDESKIIYSKAENISDFRQEYDFEKSRDANNFHHAHDAYLNVVVGRAIDRYYKHHHLYYFKDYEKMKNNNNTINPKKILAYDRIYGSDDNKEVIWDKNKTLKTIDYYIKHTFDISETLRTYEGSEMYGKVTILPANKSQNAVPVKTTDPRINTSLYGGITSNSYTKYVIVKVIDKKNKTSYILESIPYNSRNNIINYINDIYKEKKYKSIEIINDCIKTNILVQYEKTKFYITGKTGNAYLLKNATDRIFSYKSVKIIKAISKYKENSKFNNPMIETNDTIIISKNKDGGVTKKITKDDCEYLYNEIINIYSKDIYKYSNVENIVKQLISSNVNTLSLEKQIDLMYELINLLKTNERKLIDLSNINGSKNAGMLSVSKTLKPGMKFISTSITGYYKKVLFEVPNGI